MLRFCKKMENKKMSTSNLISEDFSAEKANILTISFCDKEFGLSFGAESVKTVFFSDASSKLVIEIKKIVEPMSIKSIDSIAFLRGPGSFTSSRIACAVSLGIKVGHPEVILLPILLNEAIHEVLPNITILMRCNSTFWHLYDGNWKLTTEKQLLENPPKYATSAHPIDLPTVEWPDLSSCLRKRAIHLLNEKELDLNQLEIEPFYGLEL